MVSVSTSIKDNPRNADVLCRLRQHVTKLSALFKLAGKTFRHFLHLF
jgi:hypothetical protein